MVTTEPTRRRRQHPDSPATDEDFRQLARLPAGPRREELRQDIIRAWLPVAERISRRFRNRGESAADLRQVAALALVKAVDRYDPERGHAFESFAVPTITGELKRHFRDHVWGLHVPRRLQELRGVVRAAQGRLQQDLAGREPNVVDLAAYTGLTEAEVRLGLEAEGVHHTIPLDAPLPGPDDRTLFETTGGPDPYMDLVVDLESLRPLVAALPEREKRLLYLRFYADLTQKQIGANLGVSQMQISRMLARTCGRLRDGMLAPV